MDICHHIGGKGFPGAGARSLPVFDPATGRQYGTVRMATAADVDRAVRAAGAAWPAWAQTPAIRRARILDGFRRLLVENTGELASAITGGHGKTLEDARGEIARGIEVVEFAAGAPSLLRGEFSWNIGAGIDCQVIRQPLGVIAGITPFNFPCMVPLWMFPVALACGNGFILKPSEKDPLPALLMARWLEEAGLPAGLFNVVQGDREAVDALLAHPGIHAVSFVGSTPVARHVHTTGAAAGKRTQALGGAKNHMVIMPDASLDVVVDALTGAAYGSAGERCMAISVAVPVTDALADALVERLVAAIGKLKVGPGTDPDSHLGPLISQQHRDRVLACIDQGEREGASVVVDGRTFRPAGEEYRNGYFVGCTLLDRVTPDMIVWKEEIFGPVLSVVRCPSLQAATDLVNSCQFANGAAIFTADGATARAFAQDVQAGMVGVNVPIPVPMAFHSFGGWKNSSFASHNMHGPEGVRFCTREKTTTIRWPESTDRQPGFSLPVLG